MRKDQIGFVCIVFFHHALAIVVVGCGYLIHVFSSENNIVTLFSCIGILELNRNSQGVPIVRFNWRLLLKHYHNLWKLVTHALHKWWNSTKWHLQYFTWRNIMFQNKQSSIWKCLEKIMEDGVHNLGNEFQLLVSFVNVLMMFC